MRAITKFHHIDLSYHHCHNVQNAKLYFLEDSQRYQKPNEIRNIIKNCNEIRRSSQFLCQFANRNES